MMVVPPTGVFAVEGNTVLSEALLGALYRLTIPSMGPMNEYCPSQSNDRPLPVPAIRLIRPC